MSDSAAYLAEHIGEVPVLMIPCVEVIDGDGTLTDENANQYWSSIMPATWNYMLAARSRGLGTTWTGVTIMADEEMRPSSDCPTTSITPRPSPPPTTPERPSACQTDSARRRGAFRPVVSAPPKPAAGPVTPRAQTSRRTTMDGDYDIRNDNGTSWSTPQPLDRTRRPPEPRAAPRRRKQYDAGFRDPLGLCHRS